jgi:hypothetical protein
MGDISTPPQEVLDCLAALQNVADARSQRRHTGALRTTFGVSSTGHGANGDTAAKQTKSLQASNLSPS